MNAGTLVQALGLAAGFFFGIVGHEYAHARVASALGDRTPRLHGRVTLNPKAHIDPLGTLILPGIFFLSVLVGSPIGVMFGWAKPVPLNPRQLRNPRDGSMLVAAVGPATNLVVALLAGAAFRTARSGGQVAGLLGGTRLTQFLFWFIVVNSFMFVINVLPIPPLDGSKVLARFLSQSAAYRLEELGQYGLLFLLLFFIFPPLAGILTGLTDPVCKLATGLQICL